MKKFILISVLMFFSLCAWSITESVMCLAVVEKNGKETYFALNEQPIVTHSEGKINVQCEGYSIEGLPLAEVEKLYHTESIPSGIDGINTMDGTSIDFTNGNVIFTRLNAGAQVHIYTSNGQIIGTVMASQDGIACFNLTSLKKGQVYLLSTPSITYKIVK